MRLVLKVDKLEPQTLVAGRDAQLLIELARAPLDVLLKVLAALFLLVLLARGCCGRRLLGWLQRDEPLHWGRRAAAASCCRRRARNESQAAQTGAALPRHHVGVVVPRGAALVRVRREPCATAVSKRHARPGRQAQARVARCAPVQRYIARVQAPKLLVLVIRPRVQRVQLGRCILRRRGGGGGGGGEGRQKKR